MTSHHTNKEAENSCQGHVSARPENASAEATLAPAVRPRPGELVFIAICDLSARTKGRAVRAEDFHADTSVGWVPVNLGIGPLGHIVHGLPYGSSGDVRLKPDLASAVRITGIPGQAAHTLVFADIVETDGSDWAGDPRTFLKRAIGELKGEFGIEVNAAFEHEFTDLGNDAPTHPFSLAAHRSLEPIGSQIMKALADMGAEPETWLPEYGPHQFEVTVCPAPALTAADRAVLVRDTVTAVFTGHDRDVTFSPVTKPGQGGTGVHVHFGLNDLDGNTLIFDASRPGRIAELAGKFAAGIVKYAPAMTAWFAPLMISGERLKPDNWSAARSFLGLQNREALLRITPTNELNGKDPAPQIHFEFRGADIGANPHILLGLILRAGMAGLRENLPPAEVIAGELDLAGAHSGLPTLPADLPAALDAFCADEVVRSWFSPELTQTFLAVKRDEIASLQDKSLAELCDCYREIY